MASCIDEKKWVEFNSHVAKAYKEHEQWMSIDLEIAIAIGGHVKRSYKVIGWDG